MNSLHQTKKHPSAIFFALLALGMLVSCSDDKQPGADQAPAPAAGSTVQLSDELYLGKPIVAENVTVWPVYSKKPQEDVGEFLTLAQAQERGVAAVREKGATADGAAGQQRQAREQTRNQPNRPQTAQPPARPQTAQPPAQPQTAQAQAQAQLEQQVAPQQDQTRQQQAVQVEVGNDAGQQGQVLVRQGEVDGQVNELVIDNKGEIPIFVLAGTLVKGGKQDRQIAQDFIIPPKQTVPVGAFCVEHGRWTSQREGKATAGQFEAQQMLANKSVRGSGQYKQNQGEVWNKVAQENAVAQKSPSTGTLMATVDETDKDALARRERIQKTINSAFDELSKKNPPPLGLAYAVDGKIREIRSFAHPKILGLYRQTLVNTVAMEADLAQRQALAKKTPVYSGTADAQKAVDLVKNAEKLKEDKRDYIGNANAYKQNDAVWNAKTYAKSPEGAAKPAPMSQSYQPAE
ncbi:MAG TPA: DUF6569 family protein [Planctomycetota bacterium]|jgi:hypothetical protein